MHTYNVTVEQGGSITHLNEDFFEQAILEHLDALGYERLYGPDVARTDELYHDALLPGVLERALRRVNPKAHPAALDEAYRKVANIEGADLLSRNITFTDYLQSGVEVSYFDGERMAYDNIKLAICAGEIGYLSVKRTE